MKRLIIAGLIPLGMFFTVQVWAHHAAEGIVSDEIWETVDAVLSDTPHGSLDLDAIQASMVVSDTPGYTSMESSLVVDTVDADVVTAAIMGVVVTTNGIPSGNTTSETADLLEVVAVDNGDGTTTIFIFEPIGMGNSQVVPVDSEPPKGKH